MPKPNRLTREILLSGDNPESKLIAEGKMESAAQSNARRQRGEFKDEAERKDYEAEVAAFMSPRRPDYRPHR